VIAMRRTFFQRIVPGLLLAAAASSFWPVQALAHDASAWGGLFRSRDGGQTWFQASSGKVMGSALALGVDPVDPARLLLATDSGLLASRNGGRDWELAAPDVLLGPVFAVTFARDGGTIMAAGAAAIAESVDGRTWRSRPVPSGGLPPRALAPAATADEYYLVGPRALYYTADAGSSWSDRTGGLSQPVMQLVVSRAAPELVYASSGGRIWLSRDRATTWQQVGGSLAGGQIDFLALDTNASDALWAASGTRLFHSQNGGETWQAVGEPVADASTHVRGIVGYLDGAQQRLVVSTDRGLYASSNNGASWILLVDNLPGHIEAGPLLIDGQQPAAMYAGFSVTPYAELWQTAASGRSALARLDPGELGGGAALLALVALGGWFALQWLARQAHRPGLPV